MNPITEEISQQLKELFPVNGGLYTLDVVNQQHRSGLVWIKSESIYTTLRMICWDNQGGEVSVRDIKEQEVFFVDLALLEDLDRFSAYLEGWTRAIHDLFTLPSVNLEGVMPHDLVFPRVFALKRPMTPDAFYEACCARSRLGGLTPR